MQGVFTLLLGLDSKSYYSLWFRSEIVVRVCSECIDRRIPRERMLICLKEGLYVD
jgi:hypothetical protein